MKLNSPLIQPLTGYPLQLALSHTVLHVPRFYQYQCLWLPAKISKTNDDNVYPYTNIIQFIIVGLYINALVSEHYNQHTPNSQTWQCSEERSVKGKKIEKKRHAYIHTYKRVSNSICQSCQRSDYSFIIATKRYKPVLKCRSLFHQLLHHVYLVAATGVESSPIGTSRTRQG